MALVFLTFAGVAVLGVLAVRVGIEVARFSHAVAEGTERIGRAADELERAAEPLAARSGEVGREITPGVVRGSPDE
ncbi:hypothetical protein [Streptomyces sedi]|uniref:DUF948 domain-containing protein n=1 Tax=Streptomyces sedi TaxID=555059 RepID=A0A5C4V1E4_9ACTN|nr:hypothetical protein FH715_13720 [Streptomyces sedi]